LLSDKVILCPAGRSYRRQHTFYGQELPKGGRLTDEPYRCSDAIIQTGTTSLDFPRGTTNPKVHYVGALLPYRVPGAEALEPPHRGYTSIIVVTQGTVDNADQGKLIIPALEALKEMDALVLVATGGRGTADLQAGYPQPNIQIHDYIDFAAVFEYTDAFVTNGGFGGVQLALSKGVPLVVSGINEGKSDVNARVEHAGVGINLRTDHPSPEKIGRAVRTILADPEWKSRAERMRRDFGSHNPAEAAAKVVEGVLSKGELPP
jgi:UDP:flavonoid glycosyltransferase YjiC (YdhE family)